MRTITELYSLEGRIYVYINSSQTYKHFAEAARKEGFTVPVGEDDVFALHSDFSFCHTGWAGHMLFHNPTACYDDKLVKVDYIKWISGAVEYIFHDDGR